MIKKILKRNKLIRYVYGKYNEKKNVKNRNRNLNINGKSIFSEFISICEKHNVNIWLCYGTLLGYVRENGLIKHDDDFDLGLWFDSYSKDFENDLIQNGFELEHEFSALEGYNAFEQTFKKNGVYIDLFYHFQDEEKIWTHVFHREPNDDLPNDIWRVRKLPFTKDGFKKVLFLNQNIFIPSNYEQYLCETYGDNWRIPDKKFNWKNGPLKDSIIPNVFGKMKNY